MHYVPWEEAIDEGDIFKDNTDLYLIGPSQIPIGIQI